MKESDIKHLRWMYDRLDENCGCDHMIKFKSIIDELEKENMPRQKKYKLEIPRKIHKDLAHVADSLKWFDGKILILAMEDSAGIRYECEDRTYNSTFPGAWLKEIPEDPGIKEVIINKYVDKLSALLNDEFHGYRSEVWSIIANTVRDSAENNELKHQETESFEEWFKGQAFGEGLEMGSDDYNRMISWCADTWKTANKSRGYE